MKINEKELEILLLNIREDHEPDETELFIKAIKSYSKKDLPSFNSFVNTKNSNNFLFPYFEPSTQINAEIKKYQKVFDDKCAIITFEMDGKEIDFFNPKFNEEIYQNLGSNQHKINLAAVSITDTYRDIDGKGLKGFLTRGQRKQIESQGYAEETKYGLKIYNSIMDVNSIEKINNDYAILKVKNLLYMTEKIELIITTKAFENMNNLKQVNADFYLIGSLNEE
tara:strand:+ start:2229 stop:2900 length:672 start_codon:yes stop_codon:yes gene_type:complete